MPSMCRVEMRDPSGAEVLLLARVLVRIDEAERRQRAAEIIAEVEAAARHLSLSGRCHPKWGDGSLMARCLRLDPPPEPLANDSAFLSCIVMACEALQQSDRPDPHARSFACRHRPLVW